MSDYGAGRGGKGRRSSRRGGGRSGRGRGRGNRSPSNQEHPWVAGSTTQYTVEPPPGPPQPGIVYGLPSDVIVPGTINHGLLQGEILDILKQRPSDQINAVLHQYDNQARDASTFIRNKSAYLLGIVTSGPRMGLAEGVVIPPSVKFSMVHGEVLDHLNAMSVRAANELLAQFEQDVRRDSTIRDKHAYLIDMVQKAPINGHATNDNAPVTNGARKTSSPTVPPATTSATEGSDPTSGENTSIADEGADDGTLQLLGHSLERVRLLTESLAKITAELVSEKDKRNALEAIAKSEEALRASTEQQLMSALANLKTEHELRMVAERRAEALEAQVKEEKEQKDRAEDRLAMLEELLISERDHRVNELQEGILKVTSQFDSDCESLG